MSRGLCIAFGALLLMVAEPASAQQSGVAATLESGGQTSGCVEWSHQTIAKPGHKSPDQKLVYFRFVNKCGREVSVVLVSQDRWLCGARQRSRQYHAGAGAVLWRRKDDP